MSIEVAQNFFYNAQWILCVESCLKIIAHDSTNIEAWSLCALSYANLGKLNDAIECLQEALKIDKNTGENHKFNLSLNLAEFYRRNNMTLQAIALLKNFLPKDDENLHFNLAKCYADLQDYEQSIHHYTIAIQINPKDLHAIFNLANQQAAIGSFKLALKYYSLAYEGGMGDAGINLAQIYVSLDKLDEALLLYQELESHYSQDANFYFNYANALRYNLDFENAKQMYLKAISLYADARYAINMSYLLLSLNDLENGFMFYEYRKPLIPKSLPKHFLDFSLQDKQAILAFIKDKKVAIYHEQGFGDSIMFARFLPLLECREKVLYVPKELITLFSCFNIPCSSEVIEDYDIAIPLPSLGFLVGHESCMLETLSYFRDSLLHNLAQDSLKMQEARNHIYSCMYSSSAKSHTITPFIEINHTKALSIHKVLESYNIQEQTTDFTHTFIPQYHTNTNNKNLSLSHNQAYQLEIATKKHNNIVKVGINFASNPNFQNAREKSIYARKLLESLPQNGFQYFSLQYEGIDSDLAQEFDIIDLKKNIQDFSDTARLLLQMNFVISIDSALAHLSTTLGVPTAILLYKRHDWRWGKLGNDDLTTIWYDCVHLFKQNKLHEWNNVLHNLSQFLQNLAYNMQNVKN